MANYRLAPLAGDDIDDILTTSLAGWGVAGRARYAALLAAAIEAVAARPHGPLTRPRNDLRAGVRSFHVRHARGRHGVAAPVHVLFYRLIDLELVEIIAVLHERMEPSRHLGAISRKPRRR